MMLPAKRVFFAALPAALLTTALWPAAARAQFGRGFGGFAAMEGAGQAAISANGVATVRRNPTRLRLYMQLAAKGKTLEEALSKLKELREAATVQLETLNADKKSIVFGNPSPANAVSARRRQIEAMVVQQWRSRGKKAPKGSQIAQTVALAATLTAEWPLKAESNEKLLVIARNIEEKIKAADLSGAKEAEKLSPEEQELEEEAAQAMNQSGEEQMQPGQPQFVFVAVLAKEDREKALKEAFAMAKMHAAELAKAAGVGLGPLVGLSGQCSGQSNFNNGFGGYDPSGRMQFLQQMVAQQSGDGADAKEDEAVGTDPSSLKFACYAAVQFQFGK